MLLGADTTAVCYVGGNACAHQQEVTNIACCLTCVPASASILTIGEFEQVCHKWHDAWRDVMGLVMQACGRKCDYPIGQVYT